MTVCPRCHLAHGQDSLLEPACIEAQAKAMKSLLALIADETTCNGCGEKIFFVRHKNGKLTPYTAAGLNHFIDCRKADQFSRRKKSGA